MKGIPFFRIFQLDKFNTTIKKEIMAGLIGYFTIVYIIAVNSHILSEAGIPLEAALLATILTSFVGCLLMGLWANVPILLVPGMGINALFSYTLVQSMGLTWQGALGVVFISGILFVIIAFTPIANWLSEAIPPSLKQAITVGLGLFLMLIGFEKGGIVVRGTTALVTLGDLSEPHVLSTVIGLIVTIILFIRNVKGNFLLSLFISTGIAGAFGLIDFSSPQSPPFSFEEYHNVFGAMSFASIVEIPFWIAVFSITMVLVFENIGLVHGHVDLIQQPEKFSRAFQANAVSVLFSGVFGTSPTVSTVESAASISAGGRTGLTTVTTGVLFLLSIFFIPIIKIIPDSAIAPILIIIGGLMLQSIKSMELTDFSESFPAFMIIAMIPFTYSIVDGIAAGFIMYPLIKLSTGKYREVSLPLYIIACLFLVNFLIHFYY